MSAISPHSKRFAQPLLELGDLLRELVRGEHDLVVAVVERVEGVEEFLLRALAAGEELHVVDDQHVDAPEAALELVHAVAPQGGDELVHERLGRQIDDARVLVAVEHLVTDGVRPGASCRGPRRRR